MNRINFLCLPSSGAKHLLDVFQVPVAVEHRSRNRGCRETFIEPGHVGFFSSPVARAEYRRPTGSS